MSEEFASILTSGEIASSMDGVGGAFDNAFINAFISAFGEPSS